MDFIKVHGHIPGGDYIMAANAALICFLSSTLDTETGDLILKMHFVGGAGLEVKGTDSIRDALERLGCEGMMPEELDA